MIMPNIPGTAQCPECGGENVKSKLSVTTIVAWLGKLLGVSTVKILKRDAQRVDMSFRSFENSS